jgi:CheY-specific phosphatase CheX
MQPQERAELREIVISSCRHVLPKCGMPIGPDALELAATTPDGEQLAGFIGFIADPVRGALTMMAPAQLVNSSYPLTRKPGIEGKLELFDWCGEVVNRLLGRIKGELAARGVDIEPSTPKAMMGEHLQFAIAARTAVCALQFTCQGGRVAVLVDAVAAGATIFHERRSASGLPEEGELLLF